MNIILNDVVIPVIKNNGVASFDALLMLKALDPDAEIPTDFTQSHTNGFMQFSHLLSFIEEYADGDHRVVLSNILSAVQHSNQEMLALMPNGTAAAPAPQTAWAPAPPVPPVQPAWNPAPTFTPWQPTVTPIVSAPELHFLGAMTPRYYTNQVFLPMAAIESFYNLKTNSLIEAVRHVQIPAVTRENLIQHDGLLLINRTLAEALLNAVGVNRLPEFLDACFDPNKTRINFWGDSVV